MKTKYIIITLTAMMMGITSCSLDKDPISEYSEVTLGGSDESGNRIKYNTRTEMLAQVDVMYKKMKDDQEHWVEDYLLLTEAHADNAYGGTTGAEVVPFETNSLDASNSCLKRDWNGYMNGVATANNIISNIDLVPDPALTDAERREWKAEAKIYRAMVMFDMVRIWGNFPVITQQGDDITAENIEEVYPQYFPEQNTVAEAYEQIEEDLLEGVQYAPNVSTSNKTKLTKSVARALLAKIYAEKTLRDYDKVIKYCDEVIADGFTLTTNYSDLFAMNAGNTDANNRNTSESILEIQYTPSAGNWVSWMFGKDMLNPGYQFTWAKWITPSRDLINAYTDENDVIRLNQSVVYYECTWSNYYPNDNYPFMYKIRSGASSIIKLRLADILLLKAEALVYTGDLSGAAELVNKVRNRAQLPNLETSVTSSKDKMIDAVLNERRLELAFEGHRWFDLIRNDKLVTVMNNINNKDKGRLKQARAFTEELTLLPIPQSVLDQNAKLTQNEGH